MDNQTYEIYYDREGDFLEVSFGEPAEEGTTEEIEPGVFVTKDIESERITDIGIISFKERVGILNKIMAKFKIDFPLDIKSI